MKELNLAWLELIKDGHIPVRKTPGIIRKDKRLIINPAESEIVERIFDLYYKGKSIRLLPIFLTKKKYELKNVQQLLEN